MLPKSRCSSKPIKWGACRNTFKFTLLQSTLWGKPSGERACRSTGVPGHRVATSWSCRRECQTDHVQPAIEWLLFSSLLSAYRWHGRFRPEEIRLQIGLRRWSRHSGARISRRRSSLIDPVLAPATGCLPRTRPSTRPQGCNSMTAVSCRTSASSCPTGVLRASDCWPLDASAYPDSCATTTTDGSTSAGITKRPCSSVSTIFRSFSPCPLYDSVLDSTLISLVHDRDSQLAFAAG